MDKYTPKNPSDPDKVEIEKRRSVELLPPENQTKINSEFLASTLDHLIQPQQSQEIDGYIGDKPSYFNRKSDFYVNEPNELREFYQLTTAMVQKDSITGEIDKSLFYDDLVNHLRFQGANVTNHERLFNQEYYSWQPPIDLDKFLNFRNYFWVPSGGLPIEVGVIRTSHSGDNITTTFAAPDGLTINSSLIEVQVNGNAIPLFELNQQQAAWFKIVDTSSVKVFPTPIQGDTIRISLFSPTESDLDGTVVGEETATLQTYPGYTRTLSTGMRFKIYNDVNPAYNGKVFIAEGVGRGIWLVPDTIYETAWDTSAWDKAQYDLYVNVQQADYMVIERGSEDANPWSKFNRWFHRDVIENFFDSTLVKVQAQRPIIEFQKNLELYNYGSYNRESIQLVVDDIPGFLNIILSITEANTDYASRGFSLITTNDNQSVWRHVAHDIEIWASTDSIISNEWPSKSLGYSEVRVNGVQLYDGLRFLLKNDTSSVVTNRIYMINGIASNGAIIPVLTVDGLEQTGMPTLGETVLNTSDQTTHWFNGTAWIVAQAKTTVNQAPLFNLYDMFGNQLANTGTYPKTTFFGNKIFSYAVNSNLGTSTDSVLGLRLSYDEYGEILFENYLVTDRAFYTNADNNVIEIQGFYFHKTGQYGQTPVLNNDWHKVPYVSPQKFTQRFVSDKGNNLFRMKMAPRELPFSGDFSEVKIDDVIISDNDYFIQNNILRILPELVVHGSVVEVSMIGDLVDENEFSFITERFTYSGSAIFDLQVQPITPLTNDTITVLINGVQVNILDITNESLEANQVRLTAPLNSGDIVDINVMVPNQGQTTFAFWNQPSNLVVNPGNKEVTVIGRGNFIEHFTNNIRRQENFVGVAEAVNNYRDTAKTKFLGDKILQHSAPMLKLMYMVADQQVDFIKSTRFVEREYTRFKNKFAQQLKIIMDKNELESTDPVDEWVDLALDRLNIGKTADFAFYNSGVAGPLTWIPPTPAFLGAMPIYNPEIVWDNTSGVPTKYIQGHDGSKLLAYNDVRDDVFLELENRIFNSIPVSIRQDRKEAFDFKRYKPGKFRSTEYNYAEYIGVLSPIFERWTVSNSVNHRVNATHDDYDPFTWNYSTCVDLQGESVPGNWRGIYMHFFDTDRPHTHPWECLGLTVKPTWWDTTYGVAPYTRGNTPLWNDIASGTIRFGARAGQYAHLARSTNTLSIWDILPVGTAGELLNPIAAGIIRNPPIHAQASANWNAGDFGPVETVWMQSEQWGFAQVQAAYLMKPAKFIESTWDMNNSFVEFSATDQQHLNLTTNGRPNLEDLVLHGEDEVNPIRYGVQQFLISNLNQNGLDVTASLGDPLRHTDVQLGHKLAGYVTDRIRVMTDSFGLVPNEDIIVKLYESPSVREEIYSGVIVEWTGNSYRVYGYDVLDPRFKIIPNNPTGRRVKIPIGSKQPSFVEWAILTPYAYGDLIMRSNVFYRCVRSHTSRTVFDTEFWAQVDKPGTTAWVELVKKLDPVVGAPVVAVPYGTEYRSVQDVFDFLISYERYLESRGWVFDDFDTEIQAQKDWTYSGKQFATWSINQWEPGTFIALSPVSKRLKFKSTHGLIKPIEQIINGVYSLLNRNGDRIETNRTIVSRFEDSVEITPEDPTDNLQGLYAGRLFVSEIEHAMFFNNKTIFNDLIYDPVFGLRQPRLRTSFVKTLNWNGRLDAPGFLISGDSLLSNFEKSANDFRKYFDIEDQVDDVGLKNYANHLLAYQPRPYLNQLIISDKSQLNFYQGMIQQKGTPGSLAKLLRSEFVTQDSELQMLEEWAFRLGSYGAYDSNPSMELRIPVSDYDNDPQLLEIKEVMFDDVPVHEFLVWSDDYTARTSFEVPENRDEWTNEIWDDWFVTFFKDDENDKTITAYIVRDNSGRILAGDSRWQLRPDTTARSYTDTIFPMVQTVEDSLPSAGYVHMEEYDFVFRNMSEMFDSGIYDPATGRKYKDGDVVWIYNNHSFDRREFSLDFSGNNVVDSQFNDVFAGQTNFKTDWSVYRFLDQKLSIIATSLVPNSTLVDVETTGPHGLRKGEVIVVYDMSERTLFGNPAPVVIKATPSATKFRVPIEQFTNVDFAKLVILKLCETRFNGLEKTTQRDYALKNYILHPGFDAETAAERKDKIWVDNGINLPSKSATNGWVTYEFDWLANENEAENIVYAKVEPTFSYTNWIKQDGFEAQTMQTSRFVLGKATVTAWANGLYELVEDANAPLVSTAYGLVHNATTNKLAISLGSEARYFKNEIPALETIALYGNCKSFDAINYTKLVNFEGRFVVSTLSEIASTPLDPNEFMYDGANMYYWDGATLSQITLFNGDRWIRGTEPVVYNAGAFSTQSISGTEHWINKPLGLLFKYSTITEQFAKVIPQNNTLWADSSSATVLIYSGTSFQNTTLPVDDYFYDEAGRIMLVNTTAGLVEYQLTETDVWCNQGIIYDSCNCAKLEQVNYATGDFFFDTDEMKMKKFNGVAFVDVTFDDLSPGFKLSTKDGKVYFWNQADFYISEPALFFAATLCEWDGTSVEVRTIDHLTFTITKFNSVNIYNGQVFVGTDDLLTLTNTIVFPQIEQVKLLEINWKRLGPIVTEKRRQSARVDSHSITNSLLYDSKQQQIDAFLFAYDPLKGIIPGNAAREIWFRLSQDPAVYMDTTTLGGTIDKPNTWGKQQVGMLWWDLSTVRYINYEMDSLEYKRNHWGNHAPLSQVDIYEWVRSLDTPEAYARAASLNSNQDENGTKPAGEPLRVGTQYLFNSKTEFDEVSKTTKPYYYFWVKNKRTLPVLNKVKYARKLTASQISSILTNPTQHGVVWANPIAENAMIFANVSGFLAGDDSILQVNWKINGNDGNTHRHYVLGREGDENWIPEDSLWNKMRDSLLGYVYFPKSTFIREIQGNTIELNDTLGLRSFGLIEIDGQLYPYRHGNGRFVTLETDVMPPLNATVVYESILSVPDEVLTDSQRYGTQYRPRQSWFKDFRMARKNLVENFNYQMQQVWLDRDRFDWDANLYQSESLPEAVEFDRQVPDILTRDVLLQNMQLPVGYRVLVDGNTQTENLWTLWILEDNNQAKPLWNLARAQRYRLTDFWEKADFYDASVDPTDPPQRVYKDVDDFQNKLTSSDFSDGEMVLILNVTGFWEWRRYIESSDDWSVVAREKGTIRLKTNFFTKSIRIISEDHFYRLANPSGRSDYTPFWDLTPYDANPWDAAGESLTNKGTDFSDLDTFVQHMRNRDGSIELGLILDEVRNNQTFVEYIEQNKLFFSMINYVHVEQPVVDWAFKTSYIVITGYTEELRQTEIIYPDIIGPLFDYINEVKPYHVKIRDFSRRVGYLDDAKICATDFDKPVYQNLDGSYRVLDSTDADDKAIICETVEDCTDNIYKPYGDASGTCGTPKYSPQVRSLIIEQRFDRVSCDTSQASFSPVWDIPAWDVYPWDPQAMADGSANEPYLFRIISDGRSVIWDLEETDTNRFYNVVTKSNNQTENLSYYPVFGFSVDKKWIGAIDRVVIKDNVAGTETDLPSAQWEIQDVSVDVTLRLRLVLNVAPKAGTTIEVVRNLTELDRILRMYKVVQNTKVGDQIVDLLTAVPTISGCDFDGTVIDGAGFGSGWDEFEWDFGSGTVQLPARPALSSPNRFFGDAMESPNSLDVLWFNPGNPAFEQLMSYDGTAWEALGLIVGDTVRIVETGLIKIWNGASWFNSQSLNADGWDQSIEVAKDSNINNGAPKEWEFIVSDGSDTFVLQEENADFGSLAYIVVYLDNFATSTGNLLFNNQLILFNGDVVAYNNGSGTYDFTWDNDLTLVFNTAIPAGTLIKVFKVYDYNGSGAVNSTFLPPTSNPTQDPWETLVEGGEFIQPWIAAGRPEELAYLNAQDPLVLDVYNLAAPGAPILAKNKFKGDDTTGPFAIHQMAQSVEAIQIFEDGILMDPVEYTIDWAAQTVTFNNPTLIGSQYLISSHSTGGNTLWDTIYIDADGTTSSWDLVDLPLAHGLTVTVNGIEVEFEETIPNNIVQPTIDFNGEPILFNEETVILTYEESGFPSAEDLSTGVLMNETGTFTLNIIPAPADGAIITISVFVNAINNLLFDTSEIAMINTDELIVGTDNVSVLNAVVDDLGFYHNITGPATEFTLTDVSAPTFPEWDKVAIYHNGLRICGPDTIYHTANGVDKCFTVKPITVPINKNNYAVFNNGQIIPQDDWQLPTSVDGLTNASLSAIGDWDYLEGIAWTDQHRMRLSIFNSDINVEGDVTVFDVTGNGVISQIDIVQSIWICINTNPQWDSVKDGVEIYVEDGLIKIRTNNSMSVKLTELSSAPLVSAFFGGDNPSVIADAAANEYLFGGSITAMPSIGQEIIDENSAPDWEVVPANVFDLGSADTNDSQIEMIVTQGSTTSSYVVAIYNSEALVVVDGEPLLVDGELVIIEDPSDTLITMDDVYASLETYFAVYDLPLSVVKINDTIAISTPPNCSVTLKDYGTNALVSATFGAPEATLVGETLVDPQLVATSAWMTVRVNNHYVGVNVLDLDSDGFIRNQDVITAINNSVELSALGLVANVNNFAINLTMSGHGFIQVLNADVFNIADVFFGSKKFTAGTEVTSTPGVLVVPEIPLELTINVNHVSFQVKMKDLNFNGLLTTGVVVANINAHEALASTGLVASVVDGKIQLASSSPGYIEVKDASSTYELATHFFGNWKASSGAVMISQPEDEICLDVLPNIGSSIIIGVFEHHSFELFGTKLRILNTLVNGDHITAVTFNSNNSMGIRTDRFDGNSTGLYRLSQRPTADEYIWVSLNGERLIHNQHYSVVKTIASWDEDGWDPITEEPQYVIPSTTPNQQVPNTVYGLSPLGWATDREYSNVYMIAGQAIGDDICVTTFAGAPRTEAVAWKMFRTHTGQWEHIRIADAHKTILKSDLLVDSTFMDVWESEDIPEYMRQMTPLMTPSATHNLPGTVWVNGERVNYWELQGPFIEAGRRWWRLAQIARSTFKTSFGVENIVYTQRHISSEGQTEFGIPEYVEGGHVMVEYQGTRMIPRNPDIEAAITAGTFIGNYGVWDWDYEIIDSKVVFRNAPTTGSEVFVSMVNRDYASSNITHTTGSIVIDGNINQRIPGGYTWKWHNVFNKGMQRNDDEMSKFLLARPGTPD